MPFIGIISDSKSEKLIKNVLRNKLNNNINIIIINNKSIDNFKNIKFETVLIAGNNSILSLYKETLEKIISSSKFLILNADINIELEIYKDSKLNVITYGFNSKATITASSVEEEILLCVQRTIRDINQRLIDQQEIKISFFDNIGISTDNLIGIATIALIYGKIGK